MPDPLKHIPPKFKRWKPRWRLYIVKEPGTGFYKVGITSQPMRARLSGLQVGNPRPLVRVAMRECASAQDARAKELEYLRIVWQEGRGAESEWFTGTDELATALLFSI